MVKLVPSAVKITKSNPFHTSVYVQFAFNEKGPICALSSQLYCTYVLLLFFRLTDKGSKSSRYIIFYTI